MRPRIGLVGQLDQDPVRKSVDDADGEVSLPIFIRQEVRVDTEELRSPIDVRDGDTALK